ncbi:TMPIT-like protein-domain-containing protein [Phlyctochytrium arcticum]|nr:TMPIT-like protein-domain-containing protein [Phlyctochytrium arcticum]
MAGGNIEVAEPVPENAVKAAELLTELKALETKAAYYNELAHQLNSEEAAALKDLAKQRKKVKSFLHDKGVTAAASRDQVFADRVDEIRRKLQHIENQFPKPAHFLLRLALGNTAPLSLKPLAMRLHFKHEYELFKLRFTLISIGFAVIGLFLYDGRVLDALYGFTMLYYYCTCVLREHILLVNGSRIRSWWFGHHYFSILTSGVMLIWPTTAIYRAVRPILFQFFLYVGILQYFQYRYQRNRLYVLVALDRARPMDTVSGEGFFTQSLEREFFFLLPFIVTSQIWQLYNGYLLLTLWEKQLSEKAEWQALVLSALFFILGLGNMIATVRTVMSKRRKGNRRVGPKGRLAVSGLTNLPGSPPISPAIMTSRSSSFPFPTAGTTIPKDLSSLHPASRRPYGELKLGDTGLTRREVQATAEALVDGAETGAVGGASS